MLFHVEAFGVDFYVNETDARRIDGYAALCKGEATLEQALWGDSFVFTYLEELLY